MKSRGELKDRSRWIAECAERKRTMLRRSDFDCNPIKPQRVYHEMNKVFDRRHAIFRQLVWRKSPQTNFTCLPPTPLD